LSRRYTELEVTVRASYVGPEMVPHTCDVEDRITIQLPVMDEKYVDLPKPVQGLLLGVYATHRSTVADWMFKEQERKRKENAEQKERERMALWNQEPDEDEEDAAERAEEEEAFPALEFESAADVVEQLSDLAEIITGEPVEDNPFTP